MQISAAHTQAISIRRREPNLFKVQLPRTTQKGRWRWLAISAVFFLLLAICLMSRMQKCRKRQAIQPSDQTLFGDIKGTSKITTRQAENPSIDSPFRLILSLSHRKCLSPAKVPLFTLKFIKAVVHFSVGGFGIGSDLERILWYCQMIFNAVAARTWPGSCCCGSV